MTREEWSKLGLHSSSYGQVFNSETLTIGTNKHLPGMFFLDSPSRELGLFSSREAAEAAMLVLRLTQ